MLESHTLVIRPCPPVTTNLGPGGKAIRVLEILDGTTGRLQGYVYRRLLDSVWQRWFGPVVLSVHEADDEPLVFTLRRSWPFSTTWEVRDADGNALGLLHPPLFPRMFARRAAFFLRGFPGGLHGRDGGILAEFRQNEGQRGAGSFLDHHGVKLAEAEPCADGRKLAYAEGLDGDPILKMLVLASLVSGEPS